jgi:2-hydroxychromene-2-carboxylate isomerase
VSESPASLFCFDLADPLCYLAAERALHAAIDGPLEWLPVSAGSLPQAARLESFRCQTELECFQEDVERRARALQLQPIRWPDRFPFESKLAMLAATYAKEIGRVVPFAQAAFRQGFAGGHPLDREDFVLVAAAACEMHPRAVLSAIGSSSTAQRLRSAGQIAVDRGVSELPAVVLGEVALCGDQALHWILERAGGGCVAATPRTSALGRSPEPVDDQPFTAETWAG